MKTEVTPREPSPTKRNTVVGQYAYSMNTKEKYDKNEPHEETPNKAFNN